MQVTLVVNATASSFETAACDDVVRRLGQDHDVTLSTTEGRGHATELARRAAEGGAGAVVVMGGDGTVNEAANGLLGTATVLAPLSGGSTNVFARTIGVSRQVARGAAQLSRGLAAGAWRRVGVGVVGDRAFLLHVGMGFDAAIVADVERRAAAKRLVGQGAFVMAALSAWTHGYDRSSPRFSVRHRDGSEVPDGYFAICLNSNPYTFLGPMALNVAPGTGLDTGMAMVTVRALDLCTTLGLFTSTLGTGEHLRGSSRVDYRPGVEGATVQAVSGRGPFPYQVDGEYLGDVEHLEVSHRPDALWVVIPA